MHPGEQSVLDRLSNHNVTFIIPPWQRNYDWTDDQCKTLFNDALKVYEENKDKDKNIEKVTKHFFGTIIYYQEFTCDNDVKRLILVDGQQRLTTTMLLLAAVRDLLDDDDSLKETIDSDYLKNFKVKGDEEQKIKLKQVEADWDVYRKIIINDINDPLTEKDKESNIYKNYELFKKLLIEKSKEGFAFRNAKDGLEDFELITIELEPAQNAWENPQEIFESMNSLGTPLSLADLVRNYLLLGMNSKEQDDLYKKYWVPMEKMLSGNISGYIRDFMQWKEVKHLNKATEANYKDLYTHFKEFDSAYYNNNNEEILEDLHKHAKLYNIIVFGASTGNNKIDKILSDIKVFGMETAYSLLLAILNEWDEGRLSDDDIIEILDALKIYTMRHRIMGLNRAENYGFPAYVKSIDTLVKSDNKREETFKLLFSKNYDMRLPNDIDIRERLENMNFYEFRYAKFFFSLIEESLTKYRPNINEETLTIEHIMPQTLNNEWREELGDDFYDVYLKYIHNIGNLTLLRHNSELGNKPFSEKKDVYGNNESLQLTKTEITNQEHWTESAIIERRNWIIDCMIQNILTIPESMRKGNNYPSDKKNDKSSLNDNEIDEDEDTDDFTNIQL